MSRRKDPKKAFEEAIERFAAEQGMDIEVSELGDISQNSAVRQIFFGEGSESLTDDLIAELVGMGWKKADLEKFRREGGYYCRPRNSIVFPPGAVPRL